MEIVNLYFIVAVIVGLIFPTYTIVNGGKVKELLLENKDSKTHIYHQTAIILIVLTIICIIPFLINMTSLNVIGLDFISKPVWIVGMFAISFLSLYLLYRGKLSKKNAQKFSSANERVQFLMPTTYKEYKLTIILSFIAGICEEIIYRGFLFWFLLNYLPVSLAMLLSNAPFALAHLTTTGKRNTLGAFLLAFIFSGAYMLTGSLWLSITLHILVDIYSMTLAYRSHQILNFQTT